MATCGSGGERSQLGEELGEERIWAEGPMGPWEAGGESGEGRSRVTCCRVGPGRHVISNML